MVLLWCYHVTISTAHTQIYIAAQSAEVEDIMSEFTMTREELGTVLSAQMQTRTMLAEGYKGEVTEQSQVVFIETDEFGVMNIYCKP